MIIKWFTIFVFVAVSKSIHSFEEGWLSSELLKPEYSTTESVTGVINITLAEGSPLDSFPKDLFTGHHHCKRYPQKCSIYALKFSIIQF